MSGDRKSLWNDGSQVQHCREEEPHGTPNHHGSCRLCSQGIACNNSTLDSPLDKLLTALSDGRHHDAYDLGALAEDELETLRGIAVAEWTAAPPVRT